MTGSYYRGRACLAFNKTEEENLFPVVTTNAAAIFDKAPIKMTQYLIRSISPIYITPI